MNEGQRRQAFRIEPSLDEPARINLKDGASVNALNISGNGACFRSKSPLEPGEVIPVDVWLPDREDKLKAEFEVIAIEKDSRRQRAKKVTVGEYKVRGRFKGLADISRQLIHYYVANRQRELVGILN